MHKDLRLWRLVWRRLVGSSPRVGCSTDFWMEWVREQRYAWEVPGAELLYVFVRDQMKG
jgi:hypothetical protein